MFKLFILFALCGFCAAATYFPSPVVSPFGQFKSAPLPVSKQLEQPAEIVAIIKSEAEQKTDGSYFFKYEGADGSYREEVGVIKNKGTDEEELEISGVYRYYDANGEKVEVSYVADKNGFVPSGTNIPKAISDAARSAIAPFQGKQV